MGKKALYIQDPESTLIEFFRNITKRSKIVFLTAVISGSIIHSFFFLGYFSNHDDVRRRLVTDNDILTSGRWSLKYASALSTSYTMPIIIGALCILFLALSAVYVVKFLNLKNNSSIILTAMILVSFPTTTSTFSYLFSADAYMLSLLFACLAAYFMTWRRWGIFPAIILIALSMGMYQAYICFTISLCCMWIILALLREEHTLTDIVKQIWTFLCGGVGGIVLYFICLKVRLYVNHTSLSTYKGINEMGQIDFTMIDDSLIYAAKSFVKFFMGKYILNPPDSIKLLYILMFLLMGFFLFLIIKQRKIYEKKWNLFLLGAVILSFPLAVMSIIIMAYKVSHSILEYEQISLVFVLFLALIELSNFEKTDKLSIESLSHTLGACAINGLKWISIITCVLITYHFICLDNMAYMNLHLRYEKNYATLLRVCDRIEQLPGFDKDTLLLVTGGLPNEAYPIVPWAGEELIGMVGTEGSAFTYGDRWRDFMVNFFGIERKAPSRKIKEQILLSEAYQSMPVWPAQGCTAMLDGVAVVKLSPESVP